MMLDPIIYGISRNQEWPELLVPYVGQRVMVINFEATWLQCGIISSDGLIPFDRNNEVFLLAPMYKEYRFRGKSGMKRERVLDQIKRYYPDHFEWLLFHPEWL